MKKFITSALAVLAFVGFASFANAQDILTYNLHSGMKADPLVILLQNFLISGGYLTGTNATGNFGPLTFHAVTTFQIENGIEGTGFVGPLTRKKINDSYGGTGMTSYPVGCSSPAGFSTFTGLPCTNNNSSSLSGITVSPVLVSYVTGTGATLGSSYQATAGGYNTVWFEYATSQSAFTSGLQSKAGQIILSGSANAFTANLANLASGVTYYVRAVVQGSNQSIVSSSIATFTTTGYNYNGYNNGYVDNSAIVNVSYQNQNSALSGQPYVGTNNATSIYDTNAVLSGVYDGRGSNTQVWFRYWYGGSAFNSTAQVSMGTGSGSTSYTLYGLNPATTYTYQIVATNSYGTSYGTPVMFTTIANQNINNNNNGNNNNGPIVYGNACSGAIPHVTASLDSASPSGTITTSQSQAPLLTVDITSDCDASLKSLTFASNPSSSFGMFTNYAVYENGSGTALSGTFSGNTFTLSLPVVINGGMTSTFTLKANTPASIGSTVAFSLTGIVAQSSTGISNQYPQSVSGASHAYALQANNANNGTNPQINSSNNNGTNPTNNSNNNVVH